MHVRFSTIVGLSVLEEGTNERLATISNIFIHPDTGAIEGFFVRVPTFFHSDTLFLSAQDIVHWGTHVRVLRGEVFSSIEEYVRLLSFLEEGRTVFRQHIFTESGVDLGRCSDIQFSTKTFALEWLFPKKLWWWQRPIPASSIVRVEPKGVIVREAVILPETEGSATVLEALDPLGQTA